MKYFFPESGGFCAEQKALSLNRNICIQRKIHLTAVEYTIRARRLGWCCCKNCFLSEQVFSIRDRLMVKCPEPYPLPYKPTQRHEAGNCSSLYTRRKNIKKSKTIFRFHKTAVCIKHRALLCRIPRNSTSHALGVCERRMNKSASLSLIMA